MADSIKYGMGQIRYVNSSSYMNNQNFSTKDIKTLITSSAAETESTEYYQDVYLTKDNFSFETGVSYLLHLDIPKDLSYDCIYQIKLVTELGETVDTINLNYQMLKYITVPKDTSLSDNVSRIILYPVKNDGKTPGVNDDKTYGLKIAIAKTLNDASLTENDVIYDESTGKYYIYNGSKDDNQNPIIGTSKEIENKNDTILEHVWSTLDYKTDAVGFDIIFTPRGSDITYKGILIQMQRSALDYDIYADGVYGRKIDITSSSKWNAALYQLKNLVGADNVPTPLTHIGVYGHPNLLMAINGQEIRVGQSGYYELNNFEITSLSVAANNINDKFTIDYQYKTTD